VHLERWGGSRGGKRCEERHRRLLCPRALGITQREEKDEGVGAAGERRLACAVEWAQGKRRCRAEPVVGAVRRAEPAAHDKDLSRSGQGEKQGCVGRAGLLLGRLPRAQSKEH
jgi:hypothetical protein